MRGLLLAFALALPSAFAQAGPRTVLGDTSDTVRKLTCSERYAYSHATSVTVVVLILVSVQQVHAALKSSRTRYSEYITYYNTILHNK